MSRTEDIPTRLEAVRTRLARAAARSGRPASDVRLVAVSKTFGPEDVRAAAACGQVDFGENKVQEARRKLDALADLPLTWHLIGTLQSNKARVAATTFPWIHSVTGVELLQRLEQATGGMKPRLLVQVDLAGEATKHGVVPADVPAIFDAARSCRSVNVVGLMVLPPWFDAPEAARPYFRRLRELRDELHAGGVPADMLRELSMGMSHDFEVAVEEGATIVRVGTAIFGERG